MVRLWRSGTSHSISVLSSSVCDIPRVCCSMDGTSIATACYSGQLQCWKINSEMNSVIKRHSLPCAPPGRRSELSNHIVAKGLQFMSANDAPERDPTRFCLEGQHTATVQLDWKVVASGDTLLPAPRSRFGPVLFF